MRPAQGAGGCPWLGRVGVTCPLCVGLGPLLLGTNLILIDPHSPSSPPALSWQDSRGQGQPATGRELSPVAAPGRSGGAVPTGLAGRGGLRAGAQGWGTCRCRTLSPRRSDQDASALLSGRQVAPSRDSGDGSSSLQGVFAGKQLHLHSIRLQEPLRGRWKFSPSRCCFGESHCAPPLGRGKSGVAWVLPLNPVLAQAGATWGWQGQVTMLCTW